MRAWWRYLILSWLEPFCIAIAIVLLLAGVITAWVAPRLDPTWPLVSALHAPANVLVADPQGYLGAALTTLGIIIAILIGYNVAAFQLVAQAVALGLVRAILLDLVPFLGVWAASTTVTLVYLLSPPPNAGNLWQVGLWFGTTGFFLIAYLVGLPRKLSGDFAARWAVRDLEPVPIAEWESTDGFTVIQSGLGLAVGRADVGTIRLLSVRVGRAFAGHLDEAAERHPGFLRSRMYALRNLFASCAPYRATMPGSVGYNLGYAVAGVLLQGAATGHTFTHRNGGLFDGIIPSDSNVPERTVALWAGLRHALCRREVQGDPYLRRYWLKRKRWVQNDPRLTTTIAEGLLQLHGACWSEIIRSGEQAKLADLELSDQVPELLSEVYRYLAEYLATDAQRTFALRRTKRHVVECARALLDAIQMQVRSTWPSDQTTWRQTLDAAYAKRRKEIDDTLKAL